MLGPLRASRWTRPAAVLLLAALGLLPFGLERLSAPPAAAPQAAAPEEEPPAERVDRGRIGPNGSLYLSLKALGVEEEDLFRLGRALREVFDPRTARAKDAYELRRTPDGQFLEVRYWTDELSYLSVRPSEDGTFRAERVDAEFHEETLGAYGELESSLWVAMRKQNVPSEVIFRFAEAFAWQVDFLTEPRPGDTFKLVWTRRSNDRAVIDGEILIAQYKGAVAGHRTAILHEGRYYDAEGRSLRKQFLRAPLNYRRISSFFTHRRFHPVLKSYRPHHGIDYAAAHGTPVVSIGDGVVTELGWNGAIGQRVEVRHNGTYASLYGHLSRYAAGLKPGQRVQQGQVLGYVGSTGRSTGPHLHFGFKVNGGLRDFFTMKLPPGRPLDDPADVAEFEELKRGHFVRLAQLRDLGAEAVVVRLPEGFGASGR